MCVDRDPVAAPVGDHATLSHPFAAAHRLRAPGLSPVAECDWLRIDGDEPARLAERDALVARHGPGVVAIGQGGAQAARDFAAQLRRALSAVPGYRVAPDHVQRPDGVRLGADADLLARATADDWLLLLPDDGAQGHRLVAGSACYPAHWRLQDKLGKPLDLIHAPVPGYAGSLAPRVNRIFANLSPGRPLERHNWSIGASGARYTPPEVRPPIGPEGPWLRVERQTLLRPLGSDMVIFSVRTALAPLGALDAALKTRVRAALEALPEAMRRYKFREDVLSTAEALLAPGAG
ncbi:heme-dependent oxidative N-demethylase family protein [Oceanibium sediminis]|uniref:heme-dependent oxidative N-demethylase family protein n=1 Tax=Oceanibium sediminis TaxID=2026339 RepID=UPI000DD3A679|nr:DUF3445 domain-containing protein [Oceanibium sediminis]